MLCYLILCMFADLVFFIFIFYLDVLCVRAYARDVRDVLEKCYVRWF